jgi:hypothetical protein
MSETRFRTHDNNKNNNNNDNNIDDNNNVYRFSSLLPLASLFEPEDGGRTLIGNMIEIVPDFTA